MTRITEKKQKKFWGDWVNRSLTWDSNSDNQRRAYYILNEIKKINKENLKILDIGCGSGWLSLELHKYGEVTGVDFSIKAIDKLKSKYNNLIWIAGDFCSISLPNSYFDIVTCVETIAHVPDQDAFISKISVVTKDHGWLLLTTQNEYIWSRTSWLKPPGEGQIRNWPSRQNLSKMLIKDFTIKKMYTCAPGGDRGIPRLFTNRISKRIGSGIFGSMNWIKLVERLGFGRSLFFMARRKSREKSN